MKDETSIRFIDSEYRELFRIPDGGSIRITYPPGDGREPATRVCKYLDEYHFNIGVKAGGDAAFGETYHICQFAEIMERIGATYEPAEQLQMIDLAPYQPGEDHLYTFNREKGNTCIGHIAGDFGRQGDRFRQYWSGRTGNGRRDTPKFRAELHQAVYALRQSFLKDLDSMKSYCHAHPEAKLLSLKDLEAYGFRLETKTRQYYVRCTIGVDSTFIIYPYNKAAPMREQAKPAMTPEEQIAAAVIAPGAGDPKMFYRNDGEDSHCVGYLRGDFGRDGSEFHHSWVEQDAGRKTPEFQAEFQLVMEKLRQDILKDRSASRSFCHSHPEARLPDGDNRYGFKLETESRRYFVRCTTLADDYFYVYAYDKAAPVREQERSAEKQSVLGQIRDAQKAPKPPRAPKKTTKGKDGAAL